MADNGDSLEQGHAKSVTPNQAFQECLLIAP